MLKRLCAVILVLCMLFTILPIPAMADGTEIASGTCGDNLTWVLTDDGTLTISGAGAMEDYDYVNNPLRAPWHEYRDSIETVVIEAEVTSIGDYAFAGCSELTSISFSDTVSSIGKCAFNGCSGFVVITIPDSITNIGEAAFSFCYGLTEIYIPNSVASIGSSVFNGCSNLTAIDVAPDNACYSSENGVLFDKQGEELIQFPAGIAGSYTIPDGVTSIRECAFSNCQNLTSVTIPNSLISIGDGAFCYCYRLASVSIPNSVVSIGSSAFVWCDSLTSVEIPDSVTSIGTRVFDDCHHLTAIEVDPDNDHYSSDNGILFDKEKTVLIQCPGEAGGDYVIPDSVTSIGDGAFYYSKKITSLTIPDSVISIGEGAFYVNMRLTDIYYEGTEEAWNALSNTPDVDFVHYGITDSTNHWTTTTVPATCTEDGYTDAACACGYEKAREILTATGHDYVDGICSVCGDGDTQPDSEPDDSGTCGENVYWRLDGSVLTISGEGPMEDYDWVGSPWYELRDSIESVVIEEGVTSIGGQAFGWHNNLTSVSIPNSVTSIGYQAFCWTSLTEITIPDSVTSIGNEAFFGCSNLTAIEVDPDNASYSSDSGILFDKQKTELIQCPGGFAGSYSIPDSVTSIGDYAFVSCFNLTGIVIPGSVTNIGASAFSCSGLTSVTIPASVTSIGNQAFSYCSNLTAIEVDPDNACYSSDSGILFDKQKTELIQYPGGIAGSYSIPNSVTSIGSYAFGGCHNLTSVSIHVGVTSIGDYAFEYLQDVYYGGTESDWDVLVSAAGTGARYIHYSVTDPANHWIVTTVPATCLEDGYTDAACSCGYEKERENLYATGHKYVDGVCTACGFIPEDSGTCGEGITWQLYGSALTISGEGVMEDYSWDSRAPWIEYNLAIESAVISEGITYIGNNAFTNCVKLTDITIPDSVTSIGDSVFAFCASLTNVTLPENVTSIGDYIFGQCFRLEEITIPDGVTSIGERAFLNCEALENITIPEGVVSIGYATFVNCNNLESIFIPVGITHIGDEAFFNCTALTDIYYGGTAVHWAELSNTPTASRTHYSCSNSESHWITTTVPATCEEDGYTVISCPCSYEKNRETLTATGHDYVDGVCSVCGDIDPDAEPDASGTCGENVYWRLDGSTLTIYGSGNMATYSSTSPAPWYEYCDSIESVVIEDDVTSIGDYAFYGCSSLATISIPDSITSIGRSAFNGCSSLTSIVIPDGVTSIGTNTFRNCSSLASITIPDSVTSIGMWAFLNCSSLISITIPNSVTSIGGTAFKGCSSLVEITIPCSVTSIGSYVFKDCTSLAEVSILDGVESIGFESFNGCSSLTNITIPDSVTSIDEYAFAGCSSLRSITIPDSVTRISLSSFSGCSGLQSMTIPFVGCLQRSSSDTPQWPFGAIFGEESYPGGTATEQYYYESNTDSPTSSTFYIPASLTSITVTGGEILYGAFSGCNNITSISIPDSVTSIGDYAFDGCNSLTSITIPDSVISIDSYAFSGCSSLSSITIPESVTSLGGAAFRGCSSLTSITIPEGVTSIGRSTFSGCSGLTSITVPEGVTSIRGFAFNGCSSLTSITIPDSVTSIGDSAFYGCRNLTDVYYGGTADDWEELSNTPTAYRIHYSVTDPANHWYEDGKDATCTEDGYTRTICACGYEKDSTVVTSQGHNFVDGICSVCGEPEPDVTHPMLETVTRVYGSNRYDTSFMSADTLKDLMGVNQFQNIIVASGANFPDALAGSYLASVKEAPILLVNNGTVESVKNYIRENLAPGGTVYLLGGTGVVPTSMETGLTGFTVKRLGGATRYDTNLQILLEAGIGERDILVCTGTGFADSLSASAVGLPILLVGTSLTPAQRSLLSTCSGDIIIVGGWGAVSDSVASQLEAYGPVERLSGSTRYETSTLVAERFFDDPENAVLAYAENFPDGLSGGPIANRIGAPLILTMSGRESAAASYTSRNGINHGIILGGPTLIGDKAIRSVFSLGSDVTIATR